jgi:hypothetical protein
MSTSAAVLLAALCLNPVEHVARDKVDLIEVNHFYDEKGRLVFDQVLFYDWEPMRGRYDVRAWRLLKKPTQLPQRDWRSSKFVAVWHDGETLREVEAETIRESWTQYDPELVEREYLPREKRRDLHKFVLRPGGTLR